jgi:hypothetical protein
MERTVKMTKKIKLSKSKCPQSMKIAASTSFSLFKLYFYDKEGVLNNYSGGI